MVKPLAPEESETDKEADLKAKSELIFLIEPENFSCVDDKETAKQCWDALTSAFVDSPTTRKVFLLQQLVSTKLEQHDSMESYVNTVLLLSIKVKKVDFSIVDEISKD